MMNVAHKLVEILENNGVEYVFGIPGEQILPFYEALQESSIKHILMRHELAAAHAADAYSRSTGKIGVCISTAGPGALNMVMGVATAFKDNVPLLVITGDNPTDIKNTQEFQSFPLSKIFKGITHKSYDPKTGTEAISNLYEIFEQYLTEPVHLNLSKDIQLDNSFEIAKKTHINNFDYSNINTAQEFLDNSRKPVFLLGSGAIPSRKKILDIAKKHNIPVLTTFPANTFIDSLGLVGNRGSDRSDYAIENSDCIVALGTRLTNRTINNLAKINDKLIHVNVDGNVLSGKYPIRGLVEQFLKDINFNGNYSKWTNEVINIPKTNYEEGIYDESLPLRPQAAINKIYEFFNDNIIVADAGTHTTWTTILNKYNKLIYSGGFAPMGYGVPGAIGAAIGNPDEKIIVINGDGGFQMNIQELATIKEHNLNITIFILNNSEYGIIRQYEEKLYDMKPYQTELANPDFVKIAKSYGIDSIKIQTKKDLERFLNVDSNKPCVVEIIVGREDIPQPRR